MSPLLIIGGLVAILIVVILVAVYFTSTSERAFMEERLGKYVDEPKGSSSLAQKDQGGGALSDWVNKRVEKSNLGDGIAKSLAQADMKFRPGEFVLFVILLAATLAIFAWFFGGEDPLYRSVSVLIAVVMGIGVPIFYLRSQQGRRLTRFNQQLPDMLNLMVNGLRAGYSTMQALEAVSRELPAPINEEFRRVVQEMQIGIPMDKALANLIRRIPSEDLDFVITAINVQREVGGPLAEILDTISYTIRERIRIKGEVRVMTAQVTTSGKILSGVPFFVFVLLWFINKEYMGEFFKPANLACGAGSLITGVIMIGIGYAIMMKIADIEV